jgi:hypothetical protein
MAPPPPEGHWPPAALEIARRSRRPSGSHERPPYDEAESGQALRVIHELRHAPGFGRLDDHGATSQGRWTD